MSAVDYVIGSLTAQQAVVLKSLPLFSTSISFRDWSKSIGGGGPEQRGGGS